MKHELFVEQPNMDLQEGIFVTKDTEFTYKNDKVEQKLKDLVLETIREEEGTNGINTYKSKVYISLNLNGGEILLFNEKMGYYLSPIPMERVEDAISDLESLKGLELGDGASEE